MARKIKHSLILAAYIFSVVFLFLKAQPARADDSAQLEANLTETKKSKARLQPRTPTGQIRGLEFTNEKPEVIIEISGDQITHSVVLEGRYTYPQFTLFGDLKKLSVDSDGEFSVSAEIKPKQTSVEFYSVSPLGAIQKETVHVDFTEWEVVKPKKVETVAKINPNLRRFYFFPGLGISSINYTEKGELTISGGSASTSISYKALALTAKGSMTYLLSPPYWDVSLSGYITAYSVSKNLTDEARFVGFNGRLGYTFSSIKEPWKLTLYAGYYATGVLVSTSAFGYQGIGGPQLYPSLRYKFSSSKVLSTYFKFSPVSNSLSLLDLSSREMATGLAFTLLQKHNKSWSFTLDISDLVVAFSTVTSSYTEKNRIQSKSTTIGATYGF